MLFMMTPDLIKTMIENGLPDAQVHIEGDDGTHFSALVISDTFIGKSMLAQHQAVYKTLGSKMGTDIHALSLKTYTKKAWKERQ